MNFTIEHKENLTFIRCNVDKLDTLNAPELKSHFLQRYEDILDEQHRLETQLCVFQNEMLYSFELCFRYYKTKKKGFK